MGYLSEIPGHDRSGATKKREGVLGHAAVAHGHEPGHAIDLLFCQKCQRVPPLLIDGGGARGTIGRHGSSSHCCNRSTLMGRRPPWQQPWVVADSPMGFDLIGILR